MCSVIASPATPGAAIQKQRSSGLLDCRAALTYDGAHDPHRIKGEIDAETSSHDVSLRSIRQKRAPPAGRGCNPSCRGQRRYSQRLSVVFSSVCPLPEFPRSSLRDEEIRLSRRRERFRTAFLPHRITCKKRNPRVNLKSVSS